MKADSKDVRCAMTGAPMQNQLKNTLDLHVVATTDVNGMPGSYNAYWTTKEWAETNPELAKAYQQAAKSVIRRYNVNTKYRKEVVQRFIEKDKMELSVDSILAAEQENSAVWHDDFRGAQFMLDFLYKTNYLKDNKPSSLNDYVVK
jgi:ABC-type nitrate/sulfonate/bicarbonate transport system substrate-binding protein